MSGTQDDALRVAIKAALEEHSKTVSEAMKQVQSDLKTYGAVQEGAKDAIAKLNADGAKLIAEHEATKAAKAATDARILDLEQKILVRGTSLATLTKSVGEQFIESPEWKEFALKAKSMKVSSVPFRLKTITTLPASGGPGVIPEYLPTPVIPPFQPLSIRSLLDVGTTESNLIEWVRELVFTNLAAAVAEGSLKPNSDITYERLNVPVVTIAHWIKATKQILADFKQLATLINGRLNFGLKLAEEQEILFGDGTADHLMGLVPQATPYVYTGAVLNDTRIDVVRHAMLQVMLAYYPSTGIVMSPADWHALELTKDSQMRYLMASPGAATPPMLWGLPVVQAFSMTPGKFLVGSFKLAATLFDREEAQILVSNEDQDNFVKNLVTILCEERLALAVTRPQAFVYGSFPAGA